MTSKRLIALAIRQMLRDTSPPVATLYFHPWEFDPNQARLPLGWLGRFRTYVVDLASSPNYKGVITGLRFDPVFAGAPGNMVEVAYISYRKYDEEGGEAPEGRGP